jgi:hypothetical protein
MTRHALTRSLRVSLTLLLLAPSRSSAQPQTTPRIFFAEAPAFLVRIAGAPTYRRIHGTDLQRIVNTKFLIVRDDADIHYLKARDGWLEAYGLMGEWAVSGVSPFGERTALERSIGATTIELPVSADSSAAIFISSQPAALVVTDGPPRYQTIDGTSLEYLVNTTAKVFREPTDQELYVLVAGRWFRAWATDGPWEGVASNELPADVARYAGGRLERKR